MIQISSVVLIQGKATPIIKNVFCLKETAPLPGAQIKWFNTERELLNAWSKFVRKVDPDLITGYNIMNFDFPYILTRAKKLKIGRYFWMDLSNRSLWGGRYLFTKCPFCGEVSTAKLRASSKI